MNTKVDRDRWSKSSKQSYAFHGVAANYEDIHYTCTKCQAASVFTAADQKITFEEKKHYIWQRRTLCPQCNGELYRLKERDREYQARWAKDRSNLAADSEFMREWLSVLRTIPAYSPRSRSAMAVKLATLLGEPTSPRR